MFSYTRPETRRNDTFLPCFILVEVRKQLEMRLQNYPFMFLSKSSHERNTFLFIIVLWDPNRSFLCSYRTLSVSLQLLSTAINVPFQALLSHSYLKEAKTIDFGLLAIYILMMGSLIFGSDSSREGNHHRGKKNNAVNKKKQKQSINYASCVSSNHESYCSSWTDLIYYIHFIVLHFMYSIYIWTVFIVVVSSLGLQFQQGRRNKNA